MTKDGNTCLKPEMTLFIEWTTPPPYFNDEKMTSFNLSTDLPLMLGGGAVLILNFILSEIVGISLVTYAWRDNLRGSKL